MIIHISIPEARLSTLTAQAVDDFLFCVRSIIGRGTHLVVMDRENCAFFEQKTNNREYLSIINHLYNEYTTYGSIVGDASIMIKVSDSGKKYEKVDGIFYVGIEKFIEFTPDDHSLLLVENEINDGDYYKELILCAAEKKNIPVHKIDISHAGGSPIAELFIRKIAQDRIILCLVDSDIKYPGSSPSKTVKKLQKAYKESGESICHLEVLPCHEAENTIPYNVLDELPLSPEHRATLKIMMEIEKADIAKKIPIESRFKIYYDTKKV